MMWYTLFLMVLLIPLVAIVLDSAVGRALASRLERPSGPPSLYGPSDLGAERIAYLEGEVERLAEEVVRLSQEGQFVHRLLTEGKNSEGGALPPSDDPA
jgi:hypothetical protein